MTALRRPSRRGCLVSLLIAAAVLVAGALIVRRALDLEPLRERMEAALSRAAGVPATIAELDVSLLPVPALEARGITIASPRRGEPAVTIARATLRPQVSTLLSDTVVVEHLEIAGLVVRAFEQEDGSWVWPGLPLPGDGHSAAAGRSVDVRAVGISDGRLLVAGEGGAAGTGSVENVEARLVPANGAVSIESLSGRIGRSRISGRGSASSDGARLSLEWTGLSGPDLPAVFGLIGSTVPEGLAVEASRPVTADVVVNQEGGVSVSGRIEGASLRFGGLAFGSLCAALGYEREALALEPMEFAAYGGTGKGTLEADLSRTPPAWTLRAAIDGFDVGRFLGEAASMPGRVSGRGRLGVNLTGLASPPLESARGTIDLRVRHGAIHEFPLLAFIDGALGVNLGEDDDLRFEEFSATFRLANGRATTDDLLLRHAHGRVTAGGSVGVADQSLDLEGLAVLSRARSQQAVRRVRELSRLRNAEGEIQVPVRITGTLSQPSFAIDVESIIEDAAGRELRRRLDRVLEGLIKK